MTDTATVETVPIEMPARDVRHRPGRDEYLSAESEWHNRRNEWWKSNGRPAGYEGFDEPKPDPKDFGGHQWIPGRYESEYLAEALELLADADKRHSLYLAAKQAPLIVLAGLR